MYRLKSLRKVVVLCTLVTYSFAKGSLKTEPHIRKKVIIHGTKRKSDPSAQDQIEIPRITVWLHGTKSMSFISDFVHAVPHAGLLSVEKLSSMYRIKSVMASLAQTDPHRFPLEHFYAYGWSGKLCFKKRHKEAVKLYQALAQLNEQYKSSHGVTPRITLITHSHGGNVALNLATIADKDPSLHLELIMLACPVQHETKEHVRDPIFKRIYSFYSPADMMQIIDPQGLYSTPKNQNLHFELSERIFPNHETVRQAQLEINGQGVSHIGFILERTVKILPTLLDAVEEWEQEEPSQEGKERVLEVAMPSWKSPSLSLRLGLHLKRMFKR